MARISSTMLPLGTKAPAFSLPNIDGQMISLDDWKNAKGYLVMFICNHCPFVLHVRHELSKIGKEYQNKGVAVIAVNSNDVANYPDDSPERMKIFAAENEFTFPYLYDESQETAKAYRAACTPDFFLFDRDKILVYRGQMDSGRPGNEQPVDGHDLRAALDAVIAGHPVSPDQKPSMGCNIKWKPGNEPT